MVFRPVFTIRRSIPLQRMQCGRDKVSLPITEAIAEREVTLPLYPTLREEDIVTVAQAVANALVSLDF